MLQYEFVCNHCIKSPAFRRPRQKFDGKYVRIFTINLGKLQAMISKFVFARCTPDVLNLPVLSPYDWCTSRMRMQHVCSIKEQDAVSKADDIADREMLEQPAIDSCSSFQRSGKARNVSFMSAQHFKTANVNELAILREANGDSSSARCVFAFCLSFRFCRWTIFL